MKKWNTIIAGKEVTASLKPSETHDPDHFMTFNVSGCDLSIRVLSEDAEHAFYDLTDEMRDRADRAAAEAGLLRAARSWLVKQWHWYDPSEPPEPEYDYTDQLDLVETLEEK